ncbi:MAG: metallophosphoesterase [Fimbriimonadales bacterium]|nr:metallophosphoesterase [Fimbriimonadales bacterium]
MKLSRRDFLKGIGAIAIGGAFGASARATPPAPRKRVLRVAHLTDIHLQPEGVGVESTIACLKALHESRERPDLILTGGDSVMDVFAQKAERARTLKSLWRKVWGENCKIPSRHCIGNHDVWGWNKSRSGCTGNEPDYGKKWATELFEIEMPYYAFTQAGWKFIVLDSTFPHDNGYKARLDDEQFEWLKAELRRTPATIPILVLSHMPIVCACAMFDGENEKSGDWVIPGAWMHIDARRIVELFHQHKNVKLCLSGHIHLLDRVVYNGVTYICDGAVSGGWWRGNYHQTPPGWGLVDLYDDGSFDHEYRGYRFPLPTAG